MSSSTAEAELNEDERAGLELIRESGGIHQSDFWKELGHSQRVIFSEVVQHSQLL